MYKILNRAGPFNECAFLPGRVLQGKADREANSIHTYRYTINRIPFEDLSRIIGLEECNVYVPACAASC